MAEITEKPRLVFIVPSQTSELHPDKSFKQLSSQLSLKFSVSTTNSLETVSDNEILILAADLDEFTQQDCDILQTHRNNSGALIIFISQQPSDALQNFLKNYAFLAFKEDVIESSYTPGLYHPTHVKLTQSAFLNQALAIRLEKQKQGEELAIFYPKGGYFSLQKSAVPVLTTGDGAFPVRQPVLFANESGASRMLVCGSSQMFENGGIKKFDNEQLVDCLFAYLANERECILLAQQQNYPLEEPPYVPDTQTLARNFKACLHAPDALPEDFRELIEIDDQASILPQIVKLYEQFGLPKNEPVLKLIKPSFERPTPPLVPATHATGLPEPPCAPQLELFDLDTELSSIATRLGRLALKCKATDIDGFIESAGDIFGISGSAKEILYKVLCKSVEFKKSQGRE